MSAPVRAAIYCRKSTTEGLDSEFNSLDAQREASLAYIHSQSGNGWVALSEAYEDGGYTGANLERPAFARLLADVEAGRLERVVVYKVDRLSRSLLDFARVIEIFDRRGVGLVCVTQQFDTSTSIGRLTLNMLLSFAQFERELISERTRDKVAAAKRKGRWTGGFVPLGYSNDTARKCLVVHEHEADIVREMFRSYVVVRSLRKCADELNRQGLRTKSHASGTCGGGKAWTAKTVSALLHNPVYLGVVRYRGEVFPGAHEAIITRELYDQVLALLASQRGNQSKVRRNPEYLLTGLLHCGVCDGPMFSATGSGRSGRRYRYYRCAARERGSACRPVGAESLEEAVVAQLFALASGERFGHAGSDLSEREAFLRALHSLSAAWDALLPTARAQGLRALIGTLVINPARNRVSMALRVPVLGESGLLERSVWGAPPCFEISLGENSNSDSGTRACLEPARLALQLASGHAIEHAVRNGELSGYGAAARRLRLSRARVSHLCNLTLLAPKIQAEICALGGGSSGDALNERALRYVLRTLDWSHQVERWREVLSAAGEPVHRHPSPRA